MVPLGPPGGKRGGVRYGKLRGGGGALQMCLFSPFDRVVRLIPDSFGVLYRQTLRRATEIFRTCPMNDVLTTESRRN